MDICEEEIRTAQLLGSETIAHLKNAHVAVFGVGGVGGYLCEALARAGIGHLDLFDSDSVSLSNINRQIIALHSTVGKKKVDVMRERILDINPQCEVRVFPVFYLPENADHYPIDGYDYLADAVDTVSAKIELAVRANAAGIPLISAMGAGNKLDATRFTVTDLFKTAGCPLARVMRRELKARGVSHLKVVFSPETARQTAFCEVHSSESNDFRKKAPGSISYVPATAGLLMAGEIILDLTETSTERN